MDLPTVSVVIPLYNHEKYIRAAVESVLAQEELAPHEIIIVDDGSSDGSAEIIGQIQQQGHPEIIFWSQPNQGASQAINAGLHRATGELIAILNSDDCYHPQRLNRCVRILAESPQISAVTTAIEFMNSRGAKVKNRWYEQSKAFYAQEKDLPLALMNGNFFMTTSNIVIRRHVFQDLGYFAPLRYVHDLDFFLRLLVQGKKIHLIDEPLLTYRIHGKNTILEEHVNVRAEWAFACARFIIAARNLPEWREKGWNYVARFNRIMERHSLTLLLNAYLILFAGSSNAADDSAHFGRDPEFLELIRYMSS